MKTYAVSCSTTASPETVWRIWFDPIIAVLDDLARTAESQAS